MNFLVAYDINTQTAEGRRRLRQVAKACEGYGQRVQYSLFEVVCSRTSLSKLVARLDRIVDESSDSVRIYPLDRDGFDRVVYIGIRRDLPLGDGWVL